MTNPVATQVPYDDIRRALAEANKVTPGPFKREAAVISQVQGDGWLSVMRAGQNVWNAEHAVAELVTLLLNNAEALLADAERWRMIVEPSEEVVEKVARAIDSFQRGDDFLWRTEVDTARAALRTLEGLGK